MSRDTVPPRNSQVLADAEKELNDISKAYAYNSREALHSPVHRLPPEILTRIFTINRVRARLALALARRIQIPDVFPISQVCRRWRGIILSTPSLWSDFGMGGYVLENKDQQAQAGFARTVRLFLERSKSAPLTLMFTVLKDNRWLREDKDEIPEHLSLLVDSAERWKDVSVFIEDFAHPVFRLLSSPSSGRTRLSSLHSLHLESHGFHQEIPQPFDVFEHCESLVSVRLDNLSSQWSSFRLPWRQLTRLDVSCINSPTQVTLLLRECPRLRNLTFDA
ncbi:hypothetical protein V5O48_012926, partial [Marasmius crinis-equi]